MLEGPPHFLTDLLFYHIGGNCEAKIEVQGQTLYQNPQ